MGLRRAGGTGGDGNRGDGFRIAARISTALLVLAAMMLVVFAMGDFAGAKKAKKPAGQTVHKNSTQLKYPKKTTIKSKCGKNEHIGWGGFELKKTKGDGASPYAWPDGMGPAKKKTNHWTFTAHNEFAIKSEKMSVFAYCNPGKKPKIVRHKETILYSAEEVPGNVIATCPKKHTLIGGGWYSEAVPFGVDKSSANHGQLAITALHRIGKQNAWRVRAINYKQNPVDVTAIAICGKGKKPVEKKKVTAIKPEKAGGTTIACPKGKKVLFGGLEVEDTLNYANFPLALYRDKPTSVSVYAMNKSIAAGYPPAKLVAIAYCR